MDLHLEKQLMKSIFSITKCPLILIKGGKAFLDAILLLVAFFGLIINSHHFYHTLVHCENEYLEAPQLTKNRGRSK